MDKQWMQVLNIPLTVLLVFQLSGCGTIFYPERRGQRAGHIDAGVAILDGIGLLLFIIPGVIAFAVDFSNGTIYLPASPSVTVIKQVKFDPKRSSVAEIEQIVKKETGRAIKLDQDNMEVSRLGSTDDIKTRFAERKAS